MATCAFLPCDQVTECCLEGGCLKQRGFVQSVVDESQDVIASVEVEEAPMLDFTETEDD